MTIYPIIDMLMSEKGIRRQEFVKELGFSESYISRMLNGIYPLQYHIKKAAYKLLGPMPITMDQLFTPRGDPDIYRMLGMFANYKKNEAIVMMQSLASSEKGESIGNGGKRTPTSKPGK